MKADIHRFIIIRPRIGQTHTEGAKKWRDAYDNTAIAELLTKGELRIY